MLELTENWQWDMYFQMMMSGDMSTSKKVDGRHFELD